MNRLHLRKQDHVPVHNTDELFVNKQKLGSGAYGTVYLAVNKKTGEKYARKEVSLADEQNGLPCTSLREISILKSLNRHPCIVKLKHIAFGKDKLSLFFQLAATDLQGKIKEYQKRNQDFDYDTIKDYMFQIIDAVRFAHSKAIIHRDLKPANILLDKQGKIQVCDFGLARAVQLPIEKYTHEVVTLWYRAPEVMLGQECYSQAIDMWSIGCIFAELITKRPFVCGQCEWAQLMILFEMMGKPNEQTWEGVTKLKDFHEEMPAFPPQTSLKKYFDQWKSKDLTKVEKQMLDLIQKLLKLDPSKRISAKKALEHPFFANYKAF